MHMTDGTELPEQLEPAEVARLVREEGWLIVDVREPYEREAGHIEGSMHVELKDLSARAAEIPRDTPVVFQCRVGSRSAMAAQAFRASGVGAHNLRGGLSAWVAAGLPLDREDAVVASH
jgi:hydroxyacylglutathione hydrolase/adenylyltransferase/sulfurtransferase